MRVITYNLWGLFSAHEIEGRMKVIAPQLIQYDLVCLQEQFGAEHLPLLAKPMEATHPFVFRDVQGSAVGNGLCIFSRFPFVGAPLFTEWFSHGHPEQVMAGYNSRKGVAFCRIRVPTSEFHRQEGGGTKISRGRSRTSSGISTTSSNESIELCVYTLHAIPCCESYKALGSFEKEANAAARLSQMVQTVDIIHSTRKGCENIILCGDFNANGSASPELTILRSYFHKTACSQTGSGASSHLKLRSVLGIHTEDGDDSGFFTYVSENSWLNLPKASVLSPSGWWEDFINRCFSGEDTPALLDHLLFCSPEDLECTQSAIVFSEKTYDADPKTFGGARGVKAHLSDHFGIEATFSLTAPATSRNAVEKKNENKMTDLVHEASLGYGARILAEASMDCKKRCVQLQNVSYVMLLGCLLLGVLFAPCFLAATTSSQATTTSQDSALLTTRGSWIGVIFEWFTAPDCLRGYYDSLFTLLLHVVLFFMAFLACGYKVAGRFGTPPNMYVFAEQASKLRKADEGCRGAIGGGGRASSSSSSHMESASGKTASTRKSSARKSSSRR